MTIRTAPTHGISESLVALTSGADSVSADEPAATTRANVPRYNCTRAAEPDGTDNANVFPAAPFRSSWWIVPSAYRTETNGVSLGVREKPPPLRSPATSTVAFTTLHAPGRTPPVNAAVQLGSVRNSFAAMLSCGASCTPAIANAIPSAVSPTATMTYEQPILGTRRAGRVVSHQARLRAGRLRDPAPEVLRVLDSRHRFGDA